MDVALAVLRSRLLYTILRVEVGKANFRARYGTNNERNDTLFHVCGSEFNKAIVKINDGAIVFCLNASII